MAIIETIEVGLIKKITPVKANVDKIKALMIIKLFTPNFKLNLNWYLVESALTILMPAKIYPYVQIGIAPLFIK